MRRFLAALALAGVAGQIASAQPTQLNIDSLIGLVRLDSLTSYVEYLSGIKPIYVADTVHLWQRDPVTNEIYTLPIVDTLVTLTTRTGLTNDVATYYIEKSLRSFGLDTVMVVPHSDTARGHVRSVVGYRWGSANPDRIYILCAHYDGVAAGPAADDNASGTAAVMEAARVLAGSTPHSTILFALWDAEEGGLIASRDYAAAAFDSAQDIASVVNLDMIGWDGDDDHVVEIHTNFASSFLYNELARLVSGHSIDLEPVLAYPGVTGSDHRAFWDQGYPAVLLIEEFFGGDFNPHYHRASDSLVYFNLDFFHEVSKMALASVAAFAIDPSFEPIVHVTARVFLEGPYAGAGEMAIGPIFAAARPLTQPYDGPVFDGCPDEVDAPASVVSFPDSAVDWLAVSLRSDSTASSEVEGSRRAAILMREGAVVDTDGLILAFPGIAPAPYRMVIEHRNHTGVMSADTADTSDGLGAWDFTSSASSAYSAGAPGQKDLGSGRFGLFAADASLDGQTTVADFNIWLTETKSALTGYRLGDFDLDGQVTAADFNRWLLNTKMAAASQVPD